MFVNSVKNYNIQTFKGEEAETQQQSEAAAVQSRVAEIKESAAELAQDKFEHNTVPELPPVQQNAMPAMQFPNLAQLTKMKTTQKVMGGSIFAIGALGILSALSPKKWVRLLFTIPVGGIIAYFGANMYNMANAYDKLKDIAINPPKQ